MGNFVLFHDIKSINHIHQNFHSEENELRINHIVTDK